MILVCFRVTLDAKVTRRRIFRVRLVTNTKTETISMTKMKTNMRHLRRRIFQG